jgi:hypothetical protein
MGNELKRAVAAAKATRLPVWQLSGAEGSRGTLAPITNNNRTLRQRARCFRAVLHRSCRPATDETLR